MKKTINWGIIGLGGIARKFCSDLLAVEEANIYAVASSSKERLHQFYEDFKPEKGYVVYDQILEDDQVDVVYIALPHNFHYEWSKKCLENGKAVLCEKPVTVNAGEFEELMKLAVEKKVFLMEALWTRFNPAYNKVLEILRQGTIGQVNYINADFCFNMVDSQKSRVLSMDLAGGALLDIGIYPVFLAYHLLGIPEDIMAKARFHDSGADIHTSIVFKYPDAFATINCSFQTRSDMTAKIHGDKGRIEIQPNWHEANQITLITGDRKETIDVPKKGLGFTHEILECHRCLENNQVESSSWTHQNSLELMQLLDTIREDIGLKYSFE